MKILFAGNNARGVACLSALLEAGHDVVGVLAHAHEGGGRDPRRTHGAPASVSGAARDLGLPLFQPDRVNDAATLAALRPLAPDVTVLAGYGQIVDRPFRELARLGCINLHGGKLPEYRGSSPMNWALINGETEFTLSIIQVDAGIDTGDVLAERTLPIGADDTIADLQRLANTVFPDLVVGVLADLGRGAPRPRKQIEADAAYYPLRFPDDGLLLFDTVTAVQAHNRVRALGEPYAGAFTFWKGERLTLLRSRLHDRRHHGEPGRVYRVGPRGLLVCAADRCLWIERAVVSETGDDALPLISRYDTLATVRELAVEHLVSRGRARRRRTTDRAGLAGAGR